ncbi:MAG: hypothetical protein FD152_4703 [Xanthobacteraceae bacterium]|nr:MAG: hypothetical protein FD152_4703 [Xanthobacteraceae bacterium]
MGRPWHSAAVAGLCCLALLCAGSGAAQSPDHSRLLSAIPGEVMFLRATGAWTSGEREGTTRMVILRTGSPDGAQRLYVQWLAAADRTGRIALVSTEEVPEVFDWRIAIEDYRVEPDVGGSRVLLDGRIVGSGQARRYVLAIGPPGEITFAALR